jgi:hypothetical protein
MIRIALVPVFAVTCALLAVAGLAKLRAPSAARASLRLIGIQVPTAAVRVLGAAELGLGGYAVAVPGPLTAALVALGYGAFLLATLRLLSVDANADCGCFGAAGSVAGRCHVAVCAVACSVGIAAAAVPPPGAAWIVSRAPLVAVPLVLGTATAVFATYSVFTLFAPAWRAYGSRSAT